MIRIRMDRRLAPVALVLGVAVIAAYAAAAPAPKGRDQQVRPLAVTARAVPLNPHDNGQERIGRLRYLGGLVLTSSDPRFGGISGLLWEPGCRRLLAASDDGYWFILEPAEQGEKLTGISSGWISTFHRAGDQPITSKSEVDAEALARDGDGAVWAFFEQEHRAERFAGLTACQPETLTRAADRRWPLPETRGWAMNGGAEAASGMGDALAYLSESSTTVAGARDRRGVIASPDAPNPEPRVFAYAVPAGFSPTDMDALNGDGSDGQMVILHRRLSGLGGFSALISLAELPRSAAAAEAVPHDIARIAAPLTVDNMEALAVRAEGERRYLYLMSDDNYRGFQRTLLLKFELLPEEPPVK